MKFLNLICAFTIITFFGSCKQNSETILVENKAELIENFKNIVTKENADFYKKDIVAWSKHFVQSEQVYWICVEDDVTLRATGWADLSKFVGDWMKENPVPESDASLKEDKIEDFQAEISADLAFVRYKKQHKMPDGKVKTMLEMRTFKLTDKQWKIIAMVSAPGYVTPKSTPNVFIHNDVK